MTGEANLYGSSSMQYDAAGRRTRLTYPGGGLYVDYVYDVAGDMTEVRENGATTGAGLLAVFAYDDRGRRTSLTRGNGTVTTYGYDTVSRLSELVHDPSGTSHDLTLGFSYNPASQIATSTRSNDAYAWGGHYAVNRGYTANGLNQYSAAGSITPTYDGRGNLTSAGGPTYSYNALNHLYAASNDVGFSYSQLGLVDAIITNGWATINVFHHDGANLIAERDHGSGTILRRYVHGPGVDEPLVWYEGAGTSDRRWLHADERGSVIAISNGSGAVTNINAYDESGIPASTNAGRFQYTGQRWIAELGMYDYRARIYSPTLGRFMQTDPIGYESGMNLYAYVLNDPVNLVDPSGLEWLCYDRITRGWVDRTDSDAPVVSARRSREVCINVTGESGTGENIGPSGRWRALTICPPVRARILRGRIVRTGEPRRPGAFGIGIGNGTAAIIYRQFGMSKGALRPHIGSITGIINGRTAFMGVTDSIDNSVSPIPGLSTQDALMYMNPGAVILEIMGPSGEGYSDIETVVFIVPQSVNCPTATGR